MAKLHLPTASQVESLLHQLESTYRRDLLRFAKRRGYNELNSRLLQEAPGWLTDAEMTSLNIVTKVTTQQEMVPSNFDTEYMISTRKSHLPPVPLSLPSPELHARNHLLKMSSGMYQAKNLVPQDKLEKSRRYSSPMMSSLFGKASNELVKDEKLLREYSVRGSWIISQGVNDKSNAPVLVYLHGGGMVTGSASQYAGFNDRLSEIFGIRVLAIDYRLCPDVAARDAVQDVLQAYQYLLKDLMVPANSVFFCGDSGGGQLCLLTVQAIACLQLPRPAAAWLISPVCTSDADEGIKFRQPCMDRGSSIFFNNIEVMTTIGAYVRRAGYPDESPLRCPLTNPLHGSFKNVCPLVFSIGSTEVFLLEGLETELRAKSADVLTCLHVAPHADHIFATLDCPEGKQQIKWAADWMWQTSSPK